MRPYASRVPEENALPPRPRGTQGRRGTRPDSACSSARDATRAVAGSWGREDEYFHGASTSCSSSFRLNRPETRSPLPKRLRGSGASRDRTGDLLLAEQEQPAATRCCLSL